MNTTIADSTISNISNTANCYSHRVNTIERSVHRMSSDKQTIMNYKSNEARRRHFMEHWTGHMTVPAEYVTQYMYMYVIIMAIKVQLQFIS